jgi:glycosyltransferase 2 family protein
MPGNSKKYLFLLFKLVIAAALTGLLINYASPSKIGITLKAANLWLLLSVIPLTLVSMWLAARQLKILTDCHGMNVGLLRIIGINASTEFYNLFLPGIIAGGAIRWYRLSRRNKMRAQALAVIVMNRLLTLFVLLAVGVLGWLLENSHVGPSFVFDSLLTCLLALMGGLFVLSDPRVERLIRRKLADNGTLRQYIKDKLLKLIDAANEYRRLSGRERVLLIGYATSWQLVILTSTYLFCLALGIHVPVSMLAWVRAVVTLALLAPVTISGFGVREGGWIYFLGLYGIAPADAFALSLLTFSRSFFQALIGLALELKWFLRIEAARI